MDTSSDSDSEDQYDLKGLKEKAAREISANAIQWRKNDLCDILH